MDLESEVSGSEVQSEVESRSIGFGGGGREEGGRKDVWEEKLEREEERNRNIWFTLHCRAPLCRIMYS